MIPTGATLHHFPTNGIKNEGHKMLVELPDWKEDGRQKREMAIAIMSVQPSLKLTSNANLTCS